MRVSIIKTSHSPLSYLLLTVSKTLAALFASYCDSPSKFVWISCVTAIAGRPKPAICLLPERLRWKLLPKQRYVDPHAVEVKALAQAALRWSTWPWDAHPIFWLRGGHSTTELSSPKKVFFGNKFSVNPFHGRLFWFALLEASYCFLRSLFVSE